MSERYERVDIHTPSGDEERERIVVDRTAEAQRSAYRISSFIWVFFGMLEGSLGLRVFLKLIAANPGNPFARLVYNLTDIFLWPFMGLTASPASHGFVLEIPTVIAMIVYALVGWVFVKLVWLALYRP